MASVTRQYTYPIRPNPLRPNLAQPSSKGLEWTSPYDKIFRRYIEQEGLGTCNPAALEYPRAALTSGSPTVLSNAYPDPAAHDNLWSANSFNAGDIHQPSPTFSPWLSNETNSELHQLTSFPPMTRQPSFHNDLSMSGLRISYDPTLAPSHAEEMAREMHMTTETGRWRRESRTPPPSSSRQQQRRPSSGTPSPRCRQQRRTGSSSKAHSRKSSGQLQSPRRVSGSFVNYTASDSEKLLTGVAPSGSSKTKARRERDALENRRRFSQAAVRAVVKAGGDLGELQDAGLLVG